MEISLFHFLIAISANIITIFLFAYFIYYRKYKQREGLVSYILFNVFIFLIVYFLGHFEVSLTVGFAIFGLVGLVRLRSDTFSRVDITYFIGSLTIAIVNALAHPDFFLMVLGVNAGVLVITYIVDTLLSRQTSYETLSYTMDHIPPNILRKNAQSFVLLEKELGMKVENYTITTINTIKDSVKMEIIYKK